MRANITYSVEVNSIINELVDIVTNISALGRLQDPLDDIADSLVGGNCLEAREKITEARERLANADIRLYEIDKILASYIEIVNQSEEEPEEETATEEEFGDEGG
jgi:hypothetical protein